MLQWHKPLLGLTCIHTSWKINKSSPSLYVIVNYTWCTSTSTTTPSSLCQNARLHGMRPTGRPKLHWADNITAGVSKLGLTVVEVMHKAWNLHQWRWRYMRLPEHAISALQWHSSWRSISTHNLISVNAYPNVLITSSFPHIIDVCTMYHQVLQSSDCTG